MDYHKLLQNKETVTKRMDELFARDDFSVSKEYLRKIHGYLFKGILPESGKYRYYNIRRHEVIINEDSVAYEDYNTIDTYLNMEFSDIKKCNFNELSEEEKINFIIDIVTNIWLVHPFMDGNTRTITVFIVKYLDSLGYQVDPKYFKEHADYFRNAMVRAVYSNDKYGVVPDRKPLYHFFANVMKYENERLKGDALIVREMFNVPQEKVKVKSRMPRR